ncbi:TPA: hypothetical protein ACKP74_006259, partial [Pseudomonas aeruginosa]
HRGKDMAYAVQRKWGKFGRDYLHAWDEEFGTSCMGSIKKAMTFATKDEAEAAAARAQRDCKDRDGNPATSCAFPPYHSNPPPCP